MSATHGSKLRRVTLCLMACAFVSQVAASEYLETSGDHFCPPEHRLMSYSFAVSNKQRLCNALQDWSVARLAGNASISGPGNNCEMYKVDHRKLGSSLCVPLLDFSSIRGVLLQGGFRSQQELSAMSSADWREALVAELANRTRGTRRDYDKLDNQALAGVGALLTHLTKVGFIQPSALAKFDIEDMRQSVVFELNSQTGLPLSELERLSDQQLIELFIKG